MMYVRFGYFRALEYEIIHVCSLHLSVIRPGVHELQVMNFFLK